MQQLSKRNTYTPTDTSLVCSNCDSALNKDKSLSVQSLKTFDNNPEVNHRQHRAGSELNANSTIQNIVYANNMVYVLDIDGNPLMPTKQSKSRRLLKCRRAKVIRRFPFTIQLTYRSRNHKQDITLGIDSGYENIGISAISKNKELFSANINLRTDIVKKLSDKKMYRRGRRNKLWYRKPRFLNRGISKGWLAPSIRHKLNSHIRIVDIVHKILPITNIVVETANFDIQKIKNPEIQGKEYQEGEQLGYENVKAYVLHRDNHTCQYCNKKDIKLHVHHIESRKTGGDRPDNLIALCYKCHDKYHKEKIELKIKKAKNFKAETFMSIVRKRLIEELKDKFSCVAETFGYITKHDRLSLDLEKSHINDAFCIAFGSYQKRINGFNIIQKRKNNRSLQIQRKGFKPAIRKQRYSIQPYDLLTIGDIEYVSKGIHCKCERVIIIKDNKNKSISVSKITNVFHVGSLVYI